MLALLSLPNCGGAGTAPASAAQRLAPTEPNAGGAVSPGPSVTSAPNTQSPPSPVQAPQTNDARAPSCPAPQPLPSFARELDVAVSSFAVGTPPSVAALAGVEVLRFDGRAWQKLPALQAPPSAHFELFFGRDNQQRLMGFSGEAGAFQPFYRRFKAGRFQPEPSELGPLGASGGVLYGVLGFTDPEVVCRPSEFCLVKRMSGWKRVPAHPEPRSIVLGADTAFALGAHEVERLGKVGFQALEPAHHFAHPVSVWADPNGEPWVLDAGEPAIFRLSGANWTRMPAPVGEPRALAGTRSDDVWLVGTSGAAHYDGCAWTPVPDLTGPLAFVNFAGENLWLSGAAGAFRARLSR